MEMTTRDEIALALTCASIAGGYGPGDSGSYAATAYKAADEFIEEMMTQQERRDKNG